MKGKAGNHVPLDPKTDDADVRPADLREAQGELPVEAASTPQIVRGDEMLAEFVKPYFHKDSNDNRFVGFDFSFPLEKAHEEGEQLPLEVRKAWAVIKKNNVKQWELEEFAPQTIKIALVPGEPKLALINAIIDKPVLAWVEKSGAGKTVKVLRFSFRAVVDLESTAAQFAIEHFGTSLWISMQRTQGELLK